MRDASQGTHGSAERKTNYFLDLGNLLGRVAFCFGRFWGPGEGLRKRIEQIMKNLVPEYTPENNVIDVN